MGCTTDHEPLALELPAVPSSVRQARAAVRQVLEEAGAEREAVAAVALAVSEAVTNAIVHAYPEGSPGRIWVQVAVEAGLVDVQVRDEGAGIAPRVDSPGLGLGLPTIAALAREVDLVPQPGGGTVVRMVFALDDAHR